MCRRGSSFRSFQDSADGHDECGLYLGARQAEMAREQPPRVHVADRDEGGESQLPIPAAMCFQERTEHRLNPLPVELPALLDELEAGCARIQGLELQSALAEFLVVIQQVLDRGWDVADRRSGSLGHDRI